MAESDWNEEDKENEALYTQLLVEHGPDSVRSLDWGSREGQDLRFRILTEIGIGPGDSVLDVGCGLGDYFQWLNAHDHEVRYRGIDITPQMIDSCRRKYPDVDFETCNILQSSSGIGQFDYVIASGVFAKRPAGGDAFLKSFVSRMYELCRKGVAFNSLSSWAQEKHDGEYYADPHETLRFCRHLTPWVMLRSDYHNRDFTIYAYRSRQE